MTDPHPPIRLASEAWRQLGVLTHEQYALIAPILVDRLGNPNSEGSSYILAQDIVLEFVARRNAACADDLRNRMELR